jgi:hypothetical protein
VEIPLGVASPQRLHDRCTDVEERLANLISVSPSRRMVPVIEMFPWRGCCGERLPNGFRATFRDLVHSLGASA